VAARVSFHGPHQGAGLGLPATSPLAAWTRIDIYRIVGGKIVEQWADRDDLALLRQLGVVGPAGRQRRGGEV
jgi:predicted ester cyclase